MMKKTIILLLVVCLLGGAAVGFLLSRSSAAPSVFVGQGDPAADVQAAEEAQAAPEGDPDLVPIEVTGEEETEIPEPRFLDYEKLYQSHEPDEVVATVNGREVSWSEYFYLLMSQASQVENHFVQMATYYGLPADWTDIVDESGMNYAEMTVDSIDSSLLQVYTIRGFAADHDVKLSDADREALAAQLADDILSACGEEGTEESFNEYIASIYLPRSLYDSMNEMNYLYQNGFTQLYGEDGADVSDEQAMAYLEENGYLSATHILLMSVDPTTREPLDEETLAAKKAQAEELAAQLQAIEDPEERLSRFRELKEEYCEDTGKTYYPDGYVFLPGDMVPVFEETVTSQEPYQVSDPVESDYGWHIIMTLPLDPDALVEYSSGGTPMTARSLWANEDYGRQLQEYYDSLSVEYAESFEKPDLLQFIAEE